MNSPYVSDDALRCVQFGGVDKIVGVKSGPGEEDCLKLWVWKPVTAKAGDKLPVSVYIHGGGLQVRRYNHYLLAVSLSNRILAVLGCS